VIGDALIWLVRVWQKLLKMLGIERFTRYSKHLKATLTLLTLAFYRAYPNLMTKLGIIEGFFGPQWSNRARLSFAPFLRKYGGTFYIYAPKRDACLRRAWRDDWSAEYTEFLSSLSSHFHSFGIKFGVAFSPMALGSSISNSDRQLLRFRFKILSSLNLDYLGVFFDDMPVSDGMLAVQGEVMELALECFPKGLIFCPSFYTYDPILDKVFGQRPAGYLEGLKDAIPQGIEICWSGPKVISDILDTKHLNEVVNIIGRQPFIWENFFANDGPRNCKFLRLRYLTGRDQGLTNLTSAVGFNLMNQAYLSQITFLAALMVIRDNFTPEDGFNESLRELCSLKLARFISDNRRLFLEQGLDKISEELRQELISHQDLDDSDIASEIRSWLLGGYVVGPECLTD
jgi:hyaluronoglucosaminidase